MKLLFRILLSTLLLLLTHASICPVLPTNNYGNGNGNGNGNGDDDNAACTGGSFDACNRDVFCVASFPAGCECRNSAMVRCAEACGTGARLRLEDCSVPPPPGGEAPQ